MGLKVQPFLGHRLRARDPDTMQAQNYGQVPPQQYAPPQPQATRVIVTDFDMPFLSMMGFMIKAGVAAIPAAIILGIVVGGIGALFTACVAAMGAASH